MKFMKKSNYAVKLHEQLVVRLKNFCEEKGYKQGAFVEKALAEQMEREELKEDIFDLVSLRSQEPLARPFRAYDLARR